MFKYNTLYRFNLCDIHGKILVKLFKYNTLYRFNIGDIVYIDGFWAFKYNTLYRFNLLHDRNVRLINRV